MEARTGGEPVRRGRTAGPHTWLCAPPAPGWWLAGVGVDVADVARLARVRSRRELLTHVCAPEELPPPADRARVSDRFAAQIWAAKEAVAKSLGTGFWQAGIGWPDVRVGPDLVVRLAGAARSLAGPARFDLAFEAEGTRPEVVVARVLRWLPPEGRVL